jgi:anoctamin-4
MAFDQEKFFLKVHVPWKALTRYAEVMNMKMPIKVINFLSLQTMYMKHCIKIQYLLICHKI